MPANAARDRSLRRALHLGVKKVIARIHASDDRARFSKLVCCGHVDVAARHVPCPPTATSSGRGPPIKWRSSRPSRSGRSAR